MPYYGRTDSNVVSIASIYPSAGGETLGNAATSPVTPQGDGVATSRSTGQQQVATALNVGLLGQPWKWWITLAVVLVVIKFASEHFGGEENFRNIKVGALSTLTVTLQAVVGIALLKALTVKFPTPGLTTLIAQV